LDFLDRLAERRILEAVERGELRNLPGEGLPLPPEDLDFVPAELRSAYRLLKNAGYVPPEVETLRSIGELERLVAASADPAVRDRSLRRLRLLWQRLEERSAGRASAIRAYRERLLAPSEPSRDS
jgi:hypothetical protein